MRIILILAAMMFALSACAQSDLAKGNAIFKEKGNCTKCVKGDSKCAKCKKCSKCSKGKKCRKCAKNAASKYNSVSKFRSKKYHLVSKHCACVNKR